MDSVVEKGIFSLDEGWKENNFYIVEVSIDSITPPVRAILFTGKLNAAQQPGEKSLILSYNFGKIYSAGVVHYLKAVSLLNLNEGEIPNLKQEKKEDLAKDIKAAQQKGKKDSTGWENNLL